MRCRPQDAAGEPLSELLFERLGDSETRSCVDEHYDSGGKGAGQQAVAAGDGHKGDAPRHFGLLLLPTHLTAGAWAHALQPSDNTAKAYPILTGGPEHLRRRERQGCDH
jgi:hypothetical protein